MIFITSYPYISERHRKVFDFFKKKDDIVFILPEIWKMKGGKVVMRAESNSEFKIISSKTIFFHSKYPIIRGHLKGWMPATKNILKKMAKPGDILYSVSEPNLLVTYLNSRLAKKLKLKHLFFTWQNVPYRGRLSGFKLVIAEWFIKRNMCLSNGAVCGNFKASDILRDYISGPDFKTLIAPVSGVDGDRFKPDIASDFRKNHNLENKIIVIFVGALDNRKGIFKLADAFKRAQAKENSLHLVMIGAGPLDAELKKYINKSGLEEKTTLLPWVDNKDLPGYLSNSDIFIYPSQRYGGWEEQFGYSIIEASSSGLPIISTKTGSIEDVVINGKTGILVDPEDISELVQSMLKLAKDKDLRKIMGNAGREFILNNFSHKIIAAKLEEFLRSL